MPATKGAKMVKAEKPKQQQKTSEEEKDSKGTANGGKDSAAYDSDFCKDCGKAVLASQQGLKCDSCGFWHHSLCVNIGDEIYTFLQDHGNEASIKWIYKKCQLPWNNNVALMTTVLSLEKGMTELSSSMNNESG